MPGKTILRQGRLAKIAKNNISYNNTMTCVFKHRLERLLIKKLIENNHFYLIYLK